MGNSKAGRPKVMVRCTYCRKKMGTREREGHEPKCPEKAPSTK